MIFRYQNVTQINFSNGFCLLLHAGKMSHTDGACHHGSQLDYDQRSKEQEIRQANAHDKTVLTLETTLNKRPKP